MNTYRPNTPRITLAIAAVALTLATIGVSVIVPARMDFRSRELPVVVLTQQATLAASDTALVDSIDVVASREPRLLTVVQSRRVQHG